MQRVDAAEAGPVCAHTFCASFDDTTALSGWKALAQSPATTIQLDTQQLKSPPSSLLVMLPVSASGSLATTLTQPFPQPLKGAHLELDVRVGPAVFADMDAGSGLVRLASTLRAGLRDRERRVPGVAERRAGGARRHGAGRRRRRDGVPAPVRAPAVDTWVHLKLDAVFDAAGAGSVKVTLDGATALEQGGLSIVGAGEPAVQLDLGLVSRDQTPELRVNYDNVTLDLDP